MRLPRSPVKAIDNLISDMMEDPSDDAPTWDEVATKIWKDTQILVARSNIWNTYNDKYADKNVIKALRLMGYLAPKKKRIRFTAEATEERVTEIDALLLERGFSRKELIEVLPIYIRALMPSKYQYSTAGDRSLLPIYDDE
jgi:hypothetical protein